MIKVALPNKGALFEPTLELLNACGYRVTRTGSSLSSLDPDNDVEFYFLRPGDIPLYVANGILDAGITGKDFAAEKGLASPPLLNLNYGHSQFRAAVPNASPVKTLEEVATLRVATSLPGIVRAFFAPRPVDVVPLEGAVEISVQLGIAGAVVDVVDTGTTLRQAGLRIVGEPLFSSNAALFAHPERQGHALVSVLCARIQGKQVAQDYMMVEYDAPATHPAARLRDNPRPRIADDHAVAARRMVRSEGDGETSGSPPDHGRTGRPGRPWHPVDEHRERPHLERAGRLS